MLIYRKKVPKVDALWTTFDIRKAVHIVRANDRDEGKADLRSCNSGLR